MGSMTPRRPFSMLTVHDLEQTEEDPQGARRSLDLHRAMRRVRRLTRDVEDVVAERPLTVIGVAAGASLAVGALVGARLVRMIGAVVLGYAAAEWLDR
jgi:hypothetical protein